MHIYYFLHFNFLFKSNNVLLLDKDSTLGLKELSQRQDAGTALLRKYEKLEPVTAKDFGERFNIAIEKPTENEQKLFSRILQLQTLEIFLAQDIFLDKLSATEISTLTNEVNEKYKNKVEEFELYGNISSNYYNAFIEGKFNTTISATSYDGYEIIDGIYYYYNYTTVPTPNNTPVTVKNFSNDFTTSIKNSFNALYDTTYPDAQRLSSATIKYNCHSYAWYSTSGQYWMDSPGAYWDDGSYTSSSHGTGKKIVYTTLDGYVTHSGLVSTVYSGPTNYNYNYADVVQVTSKWGAMGLYSHRGTDCPYWRGAGGVDNTRVDYFTR